MVEVNIEDDDGGYNSDWNDYGFTRNRDVPQSEIQSRLKHPFFNRHVGNVHVQAIPRHYNAAIFTMLRYGSRRFSIPHFLRVDSYHSSLIYFGSRILQRAITGICLLMSCSVAQLLYCTLCCQFRVYL
jgi:hypothetical protein